MTPQDLTRVLEVTRHIAQGVELPEVLAAVIESGLAVTEAERGSVFLHDEPAGELFMFVGTGVDGPAIRIPSDRGIVGETAQTRTTINIPDCYADPRFHADTDKATGFRTRSMLSIPLVGLDRELVGVLQLLNHADGPFDAHHQQLAEALADQAAVALQRARLLEDRLAKQRLEQEISIARQIQEDVLPNETPAVPGYEIAAHADPAEETGGDIYDLIPLPDGRICIFLADATGHGVGPALSVTQARSMLRVGLRLDADPATLLNDINAQLANDLSATRFITAFIGILDPATHTLTYAAPGQAPLVMLRVDGTADVRDATHMPLGILEDLPSEEAEPFGRHFAFDVGDMLLLLTDGFYEAQNAAGEELDQGPLIVAASQPGSVADVLARLKNVVAAHVGDGPQTDDQTAVILRRSH
ncbi:MAG: GAF domain-containing SpoIIE family protein phosphatase [Planctomycetota bacterium]